MSDNDSVLLVLFSKAKCWSYEEEFRILAATPNRGLPTTPSLPLATDNTIGLETGELASIITGCEMSEADRKVVRRLVRKYAPDVLIRRAFRNPSQYAIEIALDQQ